jgi:hypothetical protein
MVRSLRTWTFKRDGNASLSRVLDLLCSCQGSSLAFRWSTFLSHRVKPVMAAYSSGAIYSTTSTLIVWQRLAWNAPVQNEAFQTVQATVKVLHCIRRCDCRSIERSSSCIWCYICRMHFAREDLGLAGLGPGLDDRSTSAQPLSNRSSGLYWSVGLKKLVCCSCELCKGKALWRDVGRMPSVLTTAHVSRHVPGTTDG